MIGFCNRKSVLGFFAAAYSLIIVAVLPAQAPANITLRQFLERRLTIDSQSSDMPRRLSEICPIDIDAISLRVFTEYGAMFVGENTKLPSRCVFIEAKEVDKFQKTMSIGEIDIDGVKIELQKRAIDALFAAINDATKLGKRITPLDGAIAGKRTYQDTQRIWNSRFWPALDHWVAEGKIERHDAEDTIALPLRKQIEKVIDWESKGYYFSTGFSKSIFNSVAPPGTSQHLSLIAFDVVEASDPQIRKILNEHGWFQTIKTDEPHFTYLGVPESQLASRGLKQFKRGGHTFWIPNM